MSTLSNVTLERIQCIEVGNGLFGPLFTGRRAWTGGTGRDGTGRDQGLKIYDGTNRPPHPAPFQSEIPLLRSGPARWPVKSPGDCAIFDRDDGGYWGDGVSYSIPTPSFPVSPGGFGKSCPYVS